jgi:gluconate 2-dehydrogenase gamma chain
MSKMMIKDRSRRGFLGTAVAVIGAGPVLSLLEGIGFSLSVPARSDAAVFDGSTGRSASRYRCLNRSEGSFTEALVNVLCPADHLTPSGVACGLATFIDRELAADVGTGSQRFKAGIAAANGACLASVGARFDQLAAPEASRFLIDIAAGRVTDARMPLASWLNDTVNPLLLKACFTGPIYDAYCNRVFWKLFSHPGEAAQRL